MVYKTSIDYHMATPNLPEIKSYIDSESAKKVLNQFQIFGGSAEKTQPFSFSDNAASFPAAFGSNNTSTELDSLTEKSAGFSLKTILLFLSVFVAFIWFYYYQYENIRWATNLAGYETQSVIERIKFNSHINSAGEYVRKITGRIMDVDETILSPM